MSALDKLTEIVKSGENEVAGALTAAHKMVADALGSPAKPAEPKQAEAKQTEAKQTEAKPAEVKPVAAHADATKPADKPAAEKAAASPKTVMEKAGAITESKSAVDAAKGADMGYAAAFLATAALPELSIVGAGEAVAGAASSAYNYITGSGSDADKAGDAARAADVKTTLPAGKPAAALPDLHKTFSHVTEGDANATYKNWLASTGCETGDSCKVSPTPVGLGGGMFDITRADSSHQKQGQGSVTNFDTLVSKDTYEAVFNAIDKDGKYHLSTANWQNNPDTTGTDKGSIGAAPAVNDYAALINKAQTQDMQEPSGGHSEGSGDHIVHYNDKNEIDWEKKGDITKKTVDGVTTTIDNSKQTMSMTDAQGREILAKEQNGHWKIGLVSEGANSYIDINPATQTFTHYNNGVPQAAKFQGGKFIESVDDTNVAIASGAIDLSSSTFDASLGGKSDIKIGDNGAIITSADGSSIYMGRDGSAGVHLADGKTTIAYDSASKIMTLYREGQPTIELNKDQQAQLFKDHSEQMTAIKAVMERLQAAMVTGKLSNANGDSVHQEGTGPNAKLVAMTAAGLVVTGEGNGHGTVQAAGSTTRENVDAKASTDTIIDTKTGKAVAKIGFDAQGKITVDTPQVHYNGANNTARINGTQIVAGAHSVNYGDGTNINYNGTVVDKYGTTFNSEGVIVEMGSAAYTTKSSTGGADSEAALENAAKSQVAAAESIASSVRGMIAGGHATAGAIAALQSSMASLSVLIGSLSQFSDSSALATAVMAQDDVAGSLQLALSNAGNKPAADSRRVEGQRAA